MMQMAKKIKRLYIIGDSWTYGDELSNRKEQSWPILLSQEFDCELINRGESGGSNDWMFRKTVEWICNQKNLNDTVVIVGWSEPNRREEIFKFYNTSQVDSDEREKFIYTKLYNNELSHYKSICYMVTLQEFLKSKNIKYLFFQPWHDLLGSEKPLTDQRKQKEKFKWLLKAGEGYQVECYSEELRIKEIIKNIDSKYVIGPRVLDYKKEYNVHKIIHRHPNESEHKIMAKFIKEKLMEYVYD